MRHAQSLQATIAQCDKINRVLAKIQLQQSEPLLLQSNRQDPDSQDSVAPERELPDQQALAAPESELPQQALVAPESELPQQALVAPEREPPQQALVAPERELPQQDLVAPERELPQQDLEMPQHAWCAAVFAASMIPIFEEDTDSEDTELQPQDLFDDFEHAAAPTKAAWFNSYA